MARSHLKGVWKNEEATGLKEKTKILGLPDAGV